MALRVQGVATAERLRLALGSTREDAIERARALVDRGLASKQSSPSEGFALTPEGEDALDTALSDEAHRGDRELIELYESFLPVNEQVLKAASDWQVRRYGGTEIPNNHRDPDYDQAVIDRLRRSHDRAFVVIRRLAERVPRLLPYRDRLRACLERLESGDHPAFTAAFAESYHAVWFELHQDLLLTLGLERTE